MHKMFQRARDERNLTNAQISRMLGVSESFVSKIMSGKRQPGDYLTALCTLLGLPVPSTDDAKDLAGVGGRKRA